MNAYKFLEKQFKSLYHLNHVDAIASWDEAVMMPLKSGRVRAEALATLRGLVHEKLTSPKIAEYIEQAKNQNLTNPWQQANLYWMEKRFREASCLPNELVVQLTKASLGAEQAWRSLRQQNNWSEFKPFLQEVLSLSKEKATIKSEIFGLSAYDALVDEFSPGITQAFIDPIFANLEAELPTLLECAVANQVQYQSSTPPFPIEHQKALGRELMSLIGFDFEQGRLDVSHHPFCGGVAEDIRITTRYEQGSFISGVMGVCHETGHAMYEFGLPLEYLSQPVGQALGMTVHESQSLLIEMQVCRSKGFMQQLSPKLIKYFGDQPSFNPENLYHHYTHVEPGLIRVDADELSYPLHVILRYQIEKGLFNGEMDIDDLPEVWDEGMQRYFGISTKDNYRDGVMQDVHWPAGAFGYFPAYTLGALTAAQLYQAAKNKLPDLEVNIAKGNLSPLMVFLKDNIHSLASLYSFDELMIKSTGKNLSAADFLEHLKSRYQ